MHPGRSGSTTDRCGLDPRSTRSGCSIHRGRSGSTHRNRFAICGLSGVDPDHLGVGTGSIWSRSRQSVLDRRGVGPSRSGYRHRAHPDPHGFDQDRLGVDSGSIRSAVESGSIRTSPGRPRASPESLRRWRSILDRCGIDLGSIQGAP